MSKACPEATPAFLWLQRPTSFLAWLCLRYLLYDVAYCSCMLLQAGTCLDRRLSPVSCSCQPVCPWQPPASAPLHISYGTARSVSTAFRQQKRARDPSAEQAGQPPAKTAAPSKYGLQAAQSAYSWLDEEDADDNYFS